MKVGGEMRHRRRDRDKVKAVQSLSFASYIEWLRERAQAGRQKQRLAKIDTMVEQHAQKNRGGN